MNLSLMVLPGGMELMIILFGVLLLFGGKKIPSLMKGLGQGIKEFNKERAALTEPKED